MDVSSVKAERQLRTLRAIGVQTSNARTPREGCEKAVAALAENAIDVPFALIYLSPGLSHGEEPVLVAASGLESRITTEPAAWSISRVLRTGTTEMVTSPVPATVLPLLGAPHLDQACGVLVMGRPPRSKLEEGDRSFLELVGMQIKAAIANALMLEQQREHLALVENEAKFRILADASPAMIWFLEPDGKCRFVNRRCLDFFGAAEADLLGDAWGTLLHPDDARSSMEVLRDALSSYKPVRLRLRVRRADNGWYWIESHALPHFGQEGRYLGHVGYSIDITDNLEASAVLREKERSLAAELASMVRLQQVSTRLVLSGDSTSLFQEIVDTAVAITAADMGSIHLCDRNSGKLTVVASRNFDAPLLEFFASVAFQSGQRVVIDDVTKCPDLTGRPSLDAMLTAGIRAIQSTLLVNRSGEHVGILSTCYSVACRPADRDLRLLDVLARQAADLMERNRGEAEREELLESERRARAESERVVRVKDDFLATLSHELRSPLNAILGWAHMIKKDYLAVPEKVRHGVEIIERNARAQAQLISDLLDLSRIIAGKIRLDLKPVGLQAVIEAALEAVKPTADARRIQVETVIEPISETIQGDASRLQQILGNLLSNSVKFTPEGGKIHVRLAREGNHVELSIADTGRGIRANFLPRVFERFRQADASTTRQDGGLGIGLALVKQLTVLHGGEVRVASEGEGKGATFTVRLPLSVQEAPVSESAPSDHTSFELEGIRVLVVDDEPDALEIVRRLLEDRCAKVATARSVDEALQALDKESFHVLLADIGMPKRNGYELISELRKRGVRTPAAALTALARTEDRKRALLSGYQSHLAKPLEPAELVATVAALSGIGRGSQTVKVEP